MEYQHFTNADVAGQNYKSVIFGSVGRFRIISQIIEHYSRYSCNSYLSGPSFVIYITQLPNLCEQLIAFDTVRREGTNQNGPHCYLPTLHSPAIVL